MKAPTESDLQKVCLAWLRLMGAVAVRTNSGATVIPATATTRGRFVRSNDTPGCSDALVCFQGRFIAIEFKSGTGKVTDLQAAFLDSVSRADGLAMIVRSLEGLQAALRKEGYEV